MWSKFWIPQKLPQVTNLRTQSQLASHSGHLCFCKQCEDCKYWERPSWLPICPTLYWVFLRGGDSCGLRDTYSRLTIPDSKQLHCSSKAPGSGFQASKGSQNHSHTVASKGWLPKVTHQRNRKNCLYNHLELATTFCPWSHGAVLN